MERQDLRGREPRSMEGTFLTADNIKRIKRLFADREAWESKVKILYGLRLAAYRHLQALGEAGKQSEFYPLFTLANDLLDALAVDGLNPRYDGERIIIDDIR